MQQVVCHHALYMQVSILPITIPPPGADRRATNFFRQNPHPRDSFSVQNSGPRVKKKTKQKSPTPGITCLVRMPQLCSKGLYKSRTLTNTDLLNESLIKAFVPTRESCNFIGLKFLLRRQWFIRSKRLRNQFEFCDDAIT